MSNGTLNGRRGGNAGALPVALLAASLFFVGLLTLQAYRAEAARRAGARQALLGYAQVVAFQHAAEAYQLLNRDVPAAFSALDRAPAGERGVDALLGHAGEAERCGASLPSRWSFRFPAPEPGTWTASGGDGTGDPEWSANAPDADTRDRIASAARARLDGLGREGGAYALLVDARPEPLYVAIAVRWRPPPENTSVYGFRTCLDGPRGSLFRQAMLGRAALPPAITGGAPPDSVHAARVELAEGDVVWSGPIAFGAEAEDTASLRLWPPFDAMTLRTALRPPTRARLVPSSAGARPGLTLSLFALNAVLLAAALVLMGRERQLVRLRERFVSAVSHELRTPLQQMLLYGDLLQLGGLRSEQDREHAAEVVARETRRLIHLVENVLRFQPGGGRPAASRAEAPHALDELVRTVVEEFTPLAETRRVRVHLEAPSPVPSDWHPDAVRRVLLNLLDNALKYGPAGGTVTVDVRRDGSDVLLSVEDEGPGVPERERERVFDPYVRGSRHDGGETGGTGIGLAIVRDLVRAAGGDARVDQGAWGGARVEVRLPALAGVRP